jgi:hypothetical protein
VIDPRWALVPLLAVLCLGCPKDRVTSKGCREDKDCGSPAAAWRCQQSTGECYCRTDDACPAAQFCNAVGFCQDRAGCTVNADCLDPSLFCDTTSGNCLPVGRCSVDLQCALGQICDTVHGSCVDGCRGNGDCPAISCRCGDVACACTGTTQAERERCQVGVCDATFCADSTFCPYGQVCGVPPDAGTTRAQCYNDFDIDLRPYCARCTSGGGIDTCGTGANYCIIDTRTAATYCGADCSEGQSCPRGYGCRDIRVVFTRWQCGGGQACPGDNALPCGSDTDCKRGGSCLKPPGQATGLCAGQCRVREGSTFGYCSCQVDSDCAQESCSQGECTISRKKCITQDDCRPIRCVDFNGVGGCLIGQNCTPENGLTCIEVAQ